MRKIYLILGVSAVALAGMTAYQYMQPAPLTPKESIDARVQAAKKNKELTAAQESFLKIQLALVNYQVLNRHPPNKLEDLVPDYFDSVPKNPETDKPFAYHREGASYTLIGLTAAGTDIGTGDVLAKLDCKTSPSDPACNITLEGVVNPNEIVEDTFRYDATNKRDPFKPFDFSARPRNPGASTPLEQYDLGQLRLTAVLADPTRGATGIVEDQAGKGFNVRIGTKVGMNSGVVVSIEKDRLKILETEKDLTGKEAQRIVEMKIQSEPGGSQASPQARPRPTPRRK